MRLALPLVLLAALVTPACGAFQENICADGEVVVEHDGGGRGCSQPVDGDPDCPRGEVLLKNPDAGLRGCIPEEYVDTDSYTEKYRDRLEEIPA